MAMHDKSSSSTESLLSIEHQQGIHGVKWNQKAEFEDGSRPTLRHHFSRYCHLTTIARSLVSALAVWGIISASLQVSKYVSDHKAIDCGCGSSIAEAIAMGCKYDSMGATWLPDECRDDELTAQFNRAGPGPNGEWPYWTDENKTASMDLTQMAALAGTGRPFYTLWDWHVAHCFFGWKKHMRALDRVVHFDVVSAYEHIDHCEWVVHGDRDKLFYSMVALNGSTFS